MVRAPYNLDARSAAEIYRNAIALARAWTKDWADYWPSDSPDWFSTDDPGLVLFKLLARLHTALAGQLSRAPDKHQLAFLDFFGVELRGPKAASAPLTVTLSEGSGPVLLRAGTQVASSADGDLLFQTAADLLVVPAFPQAAFAIQPAADAYAETPALVGQTGAGSGGFQAIDHALYLGSETLFHQEVPVEDLRITFEGVNLSNDFFARWTNGAGLSLNPEVDLAVYDALEASFADFSESESIVVGGISSYWIAVRPAADVRIRRADQELLPQIYGIDVLVRSKPILPDATFAGSTAVDVIKGGYPFGEMPAVEDAYYIASDAVFSRAESEIALLFELSRIDPPTTVDLRWEYWSDGAWRALEVLDGTEAFTRSGTVSFTCPVLDPVEINGRMGRWIRARIAAGGYGEAAGMVITRSAAEVVDDVLGPLVTDKQEAIEVLEDHDLSFALEYRPATYTPPYLSALKLRYSLVDRPEHALALNELDFAPLDIFPYRPAVERTASYYFGFEPESFLRDVRGRTLTLLVVLSTENERSPEGGDASSASWWAFDGTEWRPLDVGDGTEGFTLSGIVTIQTPQWIARGDFFGRDLVWLRLSAPESDPRQIPPIERVIPNAAGITNAVTWTDEILGSGTSAPGLKLEFPRKPVLDGQIVQVYELSPVLAGGPGSGELTTPGGTPLAGGTTADSPQWVEWTEVPSFAFSRSTDRHYLLDHAQGILSFGDGVHGMAPPAGVNNIRAAKYESGGGRAGNVGPDLLTVLQTAHTGVDAVTNPLAAQGGADADGIEVLRSFGPQQIKATDRAVTPEDFVTIALASSQRIARAAAYGDQTGRTIVAVLPDERGAKPQVTPALVEEVEEYLRARAFFVVAERIEVVGPDYVPIDVAVRAVLQPGADVELVREEMVAALDAFFEPLGDRSLGPGWTFGASVYAATIDEILGEVSGVKIIAGVTLGAGRSVLLMERNQLPATGAIRLEVVDG